MLHNLFLVPTPLISGSTSSTIEDLFEPIVRNTKLGGKTFNPSEKGFDSKSEYGKHLFAEQVVKKNIAGINFSGFAPMLYTIADIVSGYKPPV